MKAHHQAHRQNGRGGSPYTHEVLGPVKAIMEEGGELPTIYFSESYLKQAGNLAQLRAAEAGHRLAAIWREGLKPVDDGGNDAK